LLLAPAITNQPTLAHLAGSTLYFTEVVVRDGSWFRALVRRKMLKAPAIT
jgi:hypothetical protein